MPQRSLLVADDIENQTDSGKRRSRAIGHVASFMAQRLKIGIDLLYVEDIKTYPHEFDSARIRAWHFQHQERLKVLSKQLQVPVFRTIQSGFPAEQVLKAIHSRPSPELVIVGTQGRKGLKRLLIGSVAEEVIRHSRRPVMVVGPLAQEKTWFLAADRDQPRILVATDLGKNSRAAERYSLSLAKRIGARAVLFHCLGDSYKAILHDSSMVSGWVPVNLDEILDGIRDGAVQSLQRKADFFQKHGVPCEYKIEDKPLLSSCAVYQESARGYSFIVMGTHGRNVLLEAYFGSTARETILKASIPVITVHSGK
jgi:nucleotide-binding universal stress UspA family protein